MKRLGDLENKVQQLFSNEKISKQSSQYVAEELIEPNTKIVTDTNEEILEQSNATIKGNEDILKSLFGITNALTKTKNSFDKSLKGIQTN